MTSPFFVPSCSFDMLMSQISPDRFEEISHLMIELAAGNYNASAEVTEVGDEWDAIISAVNMLGEELLHTTISKNHLNSIYQAIVDMLIIINPDRTIQTVNKFTLDLLECTEEEMINQPVQNFVDNIKAEVLEQLIFDLNTTGYSYNTELIFLTKSGKNIPTTCSTSVIKDNNNKVTGILIIAKDISRIKMTEEKLLLKNKELDTLFYKTSHDLKSPITTILGITNLAEMENKDPEITKYLDMIRQCVVNLDQILEKIRQIRDTNTVGNNIIEEIDFKSIIDISLPPLLQRYDLNSTQVTLVIQSDQKQLYKGSRNLITTIFSNILDTSIRSRKPDFVCRISCQVRETSSGYYISILDNGLGIPQKLLENAFDMFTKTNINYSGTGLELYTVRNIIHRLGGEIKLISEENKGTEIQFYLPHNTSKLT